MRKLAFPALIVFTAVLIAFLSLTPVSWALEGFLCCHPQANNDSPEGTEKSRTVITLIVDGMMKSKSGAT